MVRRWNGWGWNKRILFPETMRFRFSLDTTAYEVDLSRPMPIGIPVEFGGQQPNFFDADMAQAHALELGGFLGDTRRGGSCNVETITITPHCNGTHTECAGHILDQAISVLDMVSPTPCLALVVSVRPEAAEHSGDSYSVPLDPDEQLITRRALDSALKPFASNSLAQALVVRTLPNNSDKRWRHYRGANSHPFFSIEGMQRVLETQTSHLLVDTPSVDRAKDGGKLWVHRMFWRIAQGSRTAPKQGLPKRSITEMIYVPDDIADGLYLQDLHIAPFVAEAAPSRPILYPLRTVS
ncbi:MAG: cyclase family protein [Gammaproteobacteria bacterium]